MIIGRWNYSIRPAVVSNMRALLQELCSFYCQKQAYVRMRV